MDERTSQGKVPDNEDVKQEWLLMWGANDLRQQGHLVDVTLVAEGKKLLPCHRVVLAASSPYFRAMFSHNVIEQQKAEIELNELDFSTVSAIVDYLYTCRIDINNKNVQDLLTACSMLQILGLHGKCRRYMENRLSVENSLEVYTFAKTLCCAELQNEAFSLIARRFNDVVATSAFLKLNKDDLIDFLSSDDLLVEHEEIVYEATLAWLLEDITNRGHMINEIFSHVRMALLSDEYLEECIAKEEAIMLFPHIQAQVKAALQYKTELKHHPVATRLLEEKTPDDSAGGSSPVEDSAHFNTRNTEENNNDDATSDKNESKDPISAKLNVNSGSVASIKYSNPGEFSQTHAKFLECPFYEITLAASESVVRIPLTVTPRVGMRSNEVFLLTSGRRTIIFDPMSRRYLYGFGDEKKMEPKEDPSMPDMKNAEVYATKNGMIYLIGGLEVSRSTSVASIRSKVFCFDLERMSWKQRASLKEPRCMIGLGELGVNLYVTGGKTLADGRVLSITQTYNYDDDIWSESTEMPNPVYGHGSASCKDRLYVIGGKTAEREILNKVLFLDGETWQWTAAPSLQVPRYLAGATVLQVPVATRGKPSNDSIFVVGGVGTEGLLSSVEGFAPWTDNRWKFREEFPGHRCAQTVTTLNGNLCVVGGHVTERTAEGSFESIPKYDAFLLEPTDNVDVIGTSRQWKRIIRHIRGICGVSCACTGVRMGVAKLKDQSKACDTTPPDSKNDQLEAKS
ncbi:kelch-like protein 41 [Clavelina lepadiformis]|uniref:kelch-like protein 41 n=1 Tax=Clavelina lepadiformis TaxID=159417 RepID=UPI0040412F0B